MSPKVTKSASKSASNVASNTVAKSPAVVPVSNENVACNAANNVRTVRDENILVNGPALIDNTFAVVSGKNSEILLTPYSYQSAVAAAMLKIDEPYNFTKRIADVPFENFKIITDTVKLSLPLGSGKTLMNLMYLAINRPNWRKYLHNYFNTNDIYKKSDIQQIYKDHVHCDDYTQYTITKPLSDLFEYKGKFINYAKVTYPLNKKIRTNIVMCQKTVVDQWIRSIEKDTTLSHFTIRDSKTLQAFIDKLRTCIENNDMSLIEQYDIILINIIDCSIKNTKFYDLYNVNCVDKEKTNIIHVISDILRPYIIDTLIIDDFDMQYEGNGAKNNISAFYGVTARHNFLVSSTMNNKVEEPNCNRIDKPVSENKFELILHNIGANQFNKITQNTLLALCNINCDAKYISDHLNLPEPVYGYHVVDNKDAKKLHAIGEILSPEDKAIVTKLVHEGAYKNISEHFKTNCNSTADIFKKLMGDKYREYVIEKNFIIFIQTMLEAGKSFAQNANFIMSSFNKKYSQYQNTEFKNFKDFLTFQFNAGATATREEIYIINEQFALNIGNVLNAAKIRFNNVKNTFDKIKDRLIGDSEYCGICQENIKEAKLDIGILDCPCNYACCAPCMFSSIINTHSTKCMNCRHNINIKNILFIGTNLAESFDKIDEIDKPDKDNVVVVDDSHIKRANESEMEKYEILMKYALMTDNIYQQDTNDIPLKAEDIKSYKKADLQFNEEYENYETCLKNYLESFKNKGLLKNAAMYRNISDAIIYKNNISGLMKSNGFVGKVPGPGEYKIIIFASHDETLDNAERMLGVYGIPYVRVGGTSRQISSQIKMFDTGMVNILTINNSKYSSGLHLITANHVIMLHKIANEAEESQLCGRIVRIGQTWVPKIVTIYYDTEKKD